MTTTPELTEIDVALKDLGLHELNARTGSAEADAAEDIPVLAASIATLGLLNPLIVQKTGKVWGVLAGGRRRAALLHLANDKAAKGWTMRTKVKCRALPDDTAAATAITVAENVTTRPMEPIDEFEAFARMMETGGHGPDEIAAMFGVERRRVVDRLRFGRVHPEIRACVRARKMHLETMKAFAEHPDREVQKAVFDGLLGEGGHVSAHVVRSRLRDRGVKIGDATGQFVVEAYRAAGGEIAADLIEEDSILTDQELVDRLLLEKLEGHAEAERARLGLKWAEAKRSFDYDELRPYGRVYPGAVELDGDAKARASEIAVRLTQIEELRETDETADIDAVEEEWERLNAEYEDLTTGYAAEDLARAGVIAAWERGEIRLLVGCVRPDDKPDTKPGQATTAPTGGKTETPGEGETGREPLTLSESLKSDLETEQATVVASALAGDPALAQDLLLFKVASDVFGRFSRASYALGVSAATADRPHAKPEDVDTRPGDALAAHRGALDLTWLDEDKPVPHRFEAFRKLDPAMKARIVAVALAQTVQPTGYGWGEELLAHVARQLVPEMRAVWRPTGAAFFGRLKKGVLLGILGDDLKQPEEATRLATARKSEIVDYLDKLFAEPFATLTPEQREAVATWCPPGMEIPADRNAPAADDDATSAEDEGDGAIALGDLEEIDLSDDGAPAEAEPEPATDGDVARVGDDGDADVPPGEDEEIDLSDAEPAGTESEPA